ncbi:MAG: alanine--glyoxylate aminotransferase family protein [Firmicutes bacterium]|nr:alanine--glyoxylate aminotransferase family protein [Bacillota bacterium]
MIFPEKRHLQLPGPTAVPPRVLRAMERPMISHRSPEFAQLVADITADLQWVFCTTHPVYIINGSGTAGLEAAAANTISSGERVLVVVGGSFGRRFAAIYQAFGANVETIEVPPGKAVDPQQVVEALTRHPDTRVVAVTHHETSTGVLHPIEEIAKVVHRHSDALYVVDAISSLGAVPLQTDAWGIDVVVTGSQKALMTPPGLSMIAMNERAQKRMEGSTAPRFYFDLRTYDRSLRNNEQPYTPSISLFFALNEALHMLHEQGLEAIYQRHVQLRDAFRATVRAVGLGLLAEDAIASPTVTAVTPGNRDLDIQQVRKQLANLGVESMDGQDELKGKILRLGHMGYTDALDLLTVAAALEMALIHLGVKGIAGVGVAAAEEVLLHV